MTALRHSELVQNFQVIRVLGQGSFGKVFLVRQKSTKIQLAMKKYSKYHILKNGKQKSLVRSSKILQSLEHRNIIKFLYYAISEQDDEIFLVFQACKKGSLEQIKQRIFEMKQLFLLKEIMYQLAEGLSYLKQMSVAHRDLKPSNMAFNSNGQLKLIDFDEATCFKELEQHPFKDEGFAKQLSQQTMNNYSRRSRANSFVGTLQYMSPQMRNLTITDQRGDIWAYGCILYQLVSGRSLVNQYEADQCVQQTIDRLNQQLIGYKLPKKEIEDIIDLLKKILQENPDHRISIQKIMSHNFFYQLQFQNKRKIYHTKLIKFLRGNYNLSDPKNVVDALNMDLIGMKSGKQKFVSLSQYPVLMHFEQRFESFNQTFFKKLANFVVKFGEIPYYRVCYLFGGSKYFKQRSAINEQSKSYILYDEIDSIRIQNDSIIIEGNNRQKWNEGSCQNLAEKCWWRYTIKVVHQLRSKSAITEFNWEFFTKYFNIFGKIDIIANNLYDLGRISHYCLFYFYFLIIFNVLFRKQDNFQFFKILNTI